MQAENGLTAKKLKKSLGKLPTETVKLRNCQICQKKHQKTEKTFPRSIVYLPSVTEFDKTVAMDLKYFNEKER